MARRRAPAPRPGRASWIQFQRELAAGWPPGLTLLTGDDLYHLDRAWDALVAHLVADPEDPFALSVFGRDPVEVADVVAAARSRGMFSARRVVAVREAGLLQGEPEPLVAYASAPPPGSYLLVRAPGKLDSRRKLHQALLKHAAKRLEFALAPRADAGEVRALASERGLKLEPRLLQWLAEGSGGDLYAVVAELDKLAAWAASRPERPVAVRLEEARGLVTAAPQATGWELAEAIAARDRAGALAAVRRLEELGEPPLKTLGGLVWCTGQWLQAAAWLARRRGRPPVPPDALEAARRYRFEELLRFPARLLEADRQLKGRSLPPGAVLEQLVFGLTEAAP